MRPDIADAVHRAGWSEEYLEALYAVLGSPDCDAQAGYQIGIVDDMVRAAGFEPDRKVLEAAAACDGVRNAEYLARGWVMRQKRKQRRAKKGGAADIL